MQQRQTISIPTSFVYLHCDFFSTWYYFVYYVILYRKIKCRDRLCILVCPFCICTPLFLSFSWFVGTIIPTSPFSWRSDFYIPLSYKLSAKNVWTLPFCVWDHTKNCMGNLYTESTDCLIYQYSIISWTIKVMYRDERIIICIMKGHNYDDIV